MLAIQLLLVVVVVLAFAAYRIREQRQWKRQQRASEIWDSQFRNLGR